MTRLVTKLCVLCCLTLFSLSNSVADQRSVSLDPLFDSLLADTTTPAEAHQITGQIWQQWLKAKTPEAQQLMDLGVRKIGEFALDDAVEIFSTLIELAPDFAEAWNKRATVYFMMGRYEESSSDVVETLRLEPRHFGALSVQGLIHLREDRQQAALDWFNRAIAVNPFMQNIRLSIEQLETELKARLI